MDAPLNDPEEQESTENGSNTPDGQDFLKNAQPATVAGQQPAESLQPEFKLEPDSSEPPKSKPNGPGSRFQIVDKPSDATAGKKRSVKAGEAPGVGKWSWVANLFDFKAIPDTSFGTMVMLFLAGILLGAVVVGFGATAYVKYSVNHANELVSQANKRASEMEKQADDAQLKLHNVTVGVGQFSHLFEVMDLKPNKPGFFQTEQGGVVVYWIDGMIWRKYHLYQGKNRNSPLQKIEKRAMQKNFKYFPKLEKGIYRFGVTALDRTGKETEMSDVIELEIR